MTMHGHSLKCQLTVWIVFMESDGQLVRHDKWAWMARWKLPIQKQTQALLSNHCVSIIGYITKFSVA